MFSLLAGSITPILILLLFLMVLFGIIGGSGGSVEYQSEQDDETSGYVCSPDGELDEVAWRKYFEEKSESGVLAGHGDHIEEFSDEQGIDPVLFGAITLHESAYGTSDAIVNKNNPGGLMESDGKTLQSFSSLKEGLKAMSVTLHNRIVEDGLVTIEDLGNVYAPLDADNDPDGLNENWIPTVEKLTSNLGGLIMNCEENDDVDIDGDKAWISSHTKNITSGFGPRSCIGCSGYHKGIDVADEGIFGTPAKAFMDGEITISDSQGTTDPSDSNNMGTGYGYYVEVDHGNGIKTRYAHLMSKGKEEGTKVKKGEKIGDVGSTGASTGAHLHFEILQDGDKVDPLPHLKDLLKK